MKKLSHREVQMAGLNILIEFDKICKANHLQYSLAYGTLLGAIRHKGFIPCDEDIDICMTRPEYMRLIELASKFQNDRYQLKSNLLGNLSAPFTQYIDKKLHGVSKYSNSTRYTEWGIDIFPVDGLSNQNKDNQKIYKKEAILRKMINIAESKDEGSSLLKKNVKKVLRPILNIFGINKMVGQIERLANTYDFETSEYVGVIAWGEGAQEKISKTKFLSKVIVEFENLKFPAMSCWHEYLTNIYGNYMELPPLKDRINHDTIVYESE